MNLKGERLSLLPIQASIADQYRITFSCVVKHVKKLEWSTLAIMKVNANKI